MTVDLRDVPERWPVVSSTRLVAGRLVTVRSDRVRMPDGQIAEREVVAHPGAVAVVALDDAERVLLIRQYRHAVGRLLWELPAGLRDVHGEPTRVTAQRELLEETGHRAGDWRVLVDYFSSPGFTDERLRIFLARDLEAVPAAERDFVPQHEEAHLRLEWVPLRDAVAAVFAGDLHNAVAVTGILAVQAASGDGYASLGAADAPEP